MKLEDYKIDQEWDTRKGTKMTITAIKPDAKYPIRAKCEVSGLLHCFGVCGHTVPGVDIDIDLIKLR